MRIGIKHTKQGTPRPRIRYLAGVLVIIVSAIYPQSAAYAIATDDTTFYSLNNILVYSKNSACSAAGTVSGDGNIAKIYNYLVDKGLTAYQAGGILGNLGSEGGYSASRQEGGQPWPSGGYGIAQWTAGRRTILVNAIKKVDAQNKADETYKPLMDYYTEAYGGAVSKDSGYVAKGLPADISDRLLQVELDFLYQESTNRNVRTDIDTGATAKTEWESIKKATSITDATRIWYYNFERPRVQNETGVKQRAERGTQALKEIGVNDTSTTTTLSTASSSGCTLSANGDVATFQAFVKKYAWSSFKGHGYITPTKDYKDAITQGQKDKLHVGGVDSGGNTPGIDCNGYVTLLMHYSGWDTGFNYNGKGGATGSPTTKGTEWYWLENNWDKVNKTGHVTDTSQLRPGDVAMEVGHTWVFVGTIDGFDSTQSSASLHNRAPMASEPAEAKKATSSTTTWYRKKGTTPAI